MTEHTYPTWDHDRLIHGYWVDRGRLLAGEYPGSPDPDKVTRKLAALTEAGITSFVDLTEAGELAGGGQPMLPYDHRLPEGTRYRRFPIPDCGVIGRAGYDEIIAYIDDEIGSDRAVFVHCWGGKGRTGTVVGSWLIEHDSLDYDGVLQRMRELRRGTKKAHHEVPDTPDQFRVLRRRAEKAAGRDWFHRITGFREDDYASTQARLRVEGDQLVSTVNGRRHGIGELTLPTLAQLRCRVNAERGQRSSVQTMVGEVGSLHADPRFNGALFQVASQFNVLEMTSPHVTPEHGVTRYAGDPTQGPACAIAVGAATIYRNYFVPVGDQIGQTRDRQVDTLAGLGAALSGLTGMPVQRLWQMRNGYALGTREGLRAITAALEGASEDLRDELRGHLAIGLHRGVEVTDAGTGQRVSQAFCSALPVAYSDRPAEEWEAFARLVLQATYEATLLAATEQAAAGGSPIVLLTRVGGGAFGNRIPWIEEAIEWALARTANAGLDVRRVQRGR